MKCNAVHVCVCQVLNICSAFSPLVLSSAMTAAGSLLFTTALPETIMLAPAYRTVAVVCLAWQQTACRGELLLDSPWLLCQ